MPEQTAVPAPVIVRPIQPHESRTLREAWLWQVWSVVVAAAPDVLSVLVYLLTTDERFYDAVSKWLPWPIRYAAMTAIITYARRQIQLRKATTAPIAGTDAAKEALPAINLPR
jgi:hypothetical protein